MIPTKAFFHHEGHEGHEVADILIINFVLFVCSTVILIFVLVAGLPGVAVMKLD
jgi:hypothetical protein